jgi:hypothetical protein
VRQHSLALKSPRKQIIRFPPADPSGVPSEREADINSDLQLVGTHETIAGRGRSGNEASVSL